MMRSSLKSSNKFAKKGVNQIKQVGFEEEVIFLYYRYGLNDDNVEDGMERVLLEGKIGEPKKRFKVKDEGKQVVLPLKLKASTRVIAEPSSASTGGLPKFTPTHVPTNFSKKIHPKFPSTFNRLTLQPLVKPSPPSSASSITSSPIVKASKDPNQLPTKKHRSPVVA